MKRALPMTVAWPARILGWAGVLTLALYILCNYQGIAVRGQLARMSMPFERHDAMHTLLNRYGLLYLLKPLHDVTPSGWAGGL